MWCNRGSRKLLKDDRLLLLFLTDKIREIPMMPEPQISTGRNWMVL